MRPILERVTDWITAEFASQFHTPAVSRQSGWSFREDVHPKHGQIVLGFVAEEGTAYLLRHMGGYTFEQLSDGREWFDDHTEIDNMNYLLEKTVHAWFPIPNHLLEDDGSVLAYRNSPISTRPVQCEPLQQVKGSTLDPRYCATVLAHGNQCSRRHLADGKHCFQHKRR